MTRPTISRSDFKLRLFVDTNVLIDYLENFEGDSKKFIETFENPNFDNIELITSDYVCWELYGYFRKDLYVKKMITDKNWGFNRARKGITNFKDIEKGGMKEFGNAIDEMVKKLDNNGNGGNLTIQKLMSEKTDKFSETIEKFLKFSKFSYKDTMVLVSALSTRSNILVTRDEQFKSEGKRIAELEEENDNLDFPIEIQFKPPSDFLTEERIKNNYKNWFNLRNKDKQIGKLFKFYEDSNVICIECTNDVTIKVGDYINIVKFLDGDKFFNHVFKVEKNCLRDYDSSSSVDEGSKVTIKLAENIFDDVNLENASIFLSGE